MFDGEPEIEDDKESDLLEAVVDGVGALKKSVDTITTAILQSAAAEQRQEKAFAQVSPSRWVVINDLLLQSAEATRTVSKLVSATAPR